MNPNTANDIVVAIERLTGNFPPKIRARIREEVQAGIDAHVASLPPSVVVAPLTDNEIAFFRAAVRAKSE